MNGLLDGILVGSALLASAVYALTALGPRAWRARGLAALAQGTSRLPGFLGGGAFAQRLRATAAAAAAARSACGGCANCATETDSKPGAPAASPAVSPGKAPAGEVRIAVNQIGRSRRRATVP